jgi:penicillin-binding protein 1C
VVRVFIKFTALALGGIAFVALLIEVSRIPEFTRVQSAYHSLDRAVLDRSGQLLDEIRLESSPRRLNWTKLESVPQALIAAFRADEDAPALSQQVADDLFAQASFTPLRRRLRALALALSWSRREILESYINLVEYKSGLQGLAAASFALFDKAPENLTPVEAAILTASIHTPARDVKLLRQRTCRLLTRMGAAESCGLVSETSLAYLNQTLRIQPFVRMAPAVAARMKDMPEAAREGLIRTTLDRELQWKVLSLLQAKVAEIPVKTAEGAVVVLANDGEVLAYAGGADRATARDDAAAPRATGSILLPLLYAKALDERVITVTTPLPGTKSLRAALTEQLSVPALQTLQWLGADTFVRTLADFGFTALKPAEEYGPSLALGTPEAGLFEVTNAYRALVNGGVWGPARFSPQQLSERAAQRALSPATAFLMTDLLTDRASNLWTALHTSVETEGSWCVGFSEKFTVGVRLNSMAAPALWHEVIALLHREQGSRRPPPPKEPARPPVEPTTAVTRIAYPQDRAQIEWENETSDFLIQITAPRDDQNLYLNGKRLGRARPLLPWAPEAGQYTLELRDSQGQVLHKVRFGILSRKGV